MTLQKSPSNLKEGSSVTKNTLADFCIHCNQKFKERDRITIVDNNVVHATCAELYKSGKSIEIYKTEFPYLSEAIIDKLFYTEGIEAFQKIRDNAWIIIENLGLQEMVVTGYATEDEVVEHIERHYNEESNEQNVTINEIFNNGEKYDYSVSITASVSPA